MTTIVENLRLNNATAKSPDDILQEHMIATYKNLRWGLVTIGFLFPLLLPLIGWLWYNIGLQNSLSAYYFAIAEERSEGPLQRFLTTIDIQPINYLLFFLKQLDGQTPMRSWFVGLLFVLGILLFLYKGMGAQENWWLNLAGWFAIGVALFPMQWKCTDNCLKVTLHDVCTFLSFACIAWVAVFSSNETLKRLPASKQATYRLLYYATAAGMILFPIIAYLITAVIQRKEYTIFYMELLGLWTFAAYWAIKSKELFESKIEEQAVGKDPEPTSKSLY